LSWVAGSAVRARWPGAPSDDTALQPWIDDAEVLIRSEFPWVDDQLPTDPTLQPVLNLVVTRMVIRALSVPFGLRNEAVGDTSVNYYTEAAGLYLTDADRALLQGLAPQTAFTVDGVPLLNGSAPPDDWRWLWARGFDSWNDYYAWTS
jgi:hypothetical protein